MNESYPHSHACSLLYMTCLKWYRLHWSRDWYRSMQVSSLLYISLCPCRHTVSHTLVMMSGKLLQLLCSHKTLRAYVSSLHYLQLSLTHSLSLSRPTASYWQPVNLQASSLYTSEPGSLSLSFIAYIHRIGWSIGNIVNSRILEFLSTDSRFCRIK